VAHKNDITIQHEASSVRTGTDTDSIFFTRQGIPSALTSLPLRYMHSPVETASLSDIFRLSDLMVAFVLSLNSDQQFNLLN